MYSDVRWFAVVCIMVLILQVQCRVIDEVEEENVFSRVGQEDPYEEEPFEEDRYEEPMMSDEPVGGRRQQQEQDTTRLEREEEQERPYRTCSGPQDCYSDECCHIGMQRFSEPNCRKLGAEGDYCRVGQEPSNRTLYYPNGESKDVTNGYILFCPCAEGLTCLRALCRPFKELYLLDKNHENTL